MKISANIQFITEVDGIYMFWVQYGDTGRMVQLTEADLEDEDEP